METRSHESLSQIKRNNFHFCFSIAWIARGKVRSTWYSACRGSRKSFSSQDGRIASWPSYRDAKYATTCALMRGMSQEHINAASTFPEKYWSPAAAPMMGALTSGG